MAKTMAAITFQAGHDIRRKSAATDKSYNCSSLLPHSFAMLTSANVQVKWSRRIAVVSGTQGLGARLALVLGSTCLLRPLRRPKPASSRTFERKCHGRLTHPARSLVRHPGAGGHASSSLGLKATRKRST